MTNIAKWIIFVGIGIILIGLIVLLLTKIGVPIGKLPGDIQVKGEKFRLYIPIVTSIVLSIILTIAINLILWLFRR